MSPAPRRKLSERFRPQFLFTLDQVAFVVNVPLDNIFDYVWTEYSKDPPKGRMQSVTITNYKGQKELRVPETELDQWAEKHGYTAMRFML